MIEYMYSRMIATIASIALVAIVISSSLGAIQQAEKDCAKSIANDLCQLIDSAGRMQIQSFEQKILIDESGSHRDLTVTFNRTYLIVRNGGFECSMGFAVPVTLVSSGEPIENLTVVSGSVLSIKTVDDLFDGINEVIIESVDPSIHLTSLATAWENLSASTVVL